jgi:xanthine dehydrogenase YagT iron-sulfur-binding subunit
MDKRQQSDGMRRRGFFGALGAGVVGINAVTNAAPSAENSVPSTGLVGISLRVNEQSLRVSVEPRWTLSYVLRDRLGMTGTKVGCDRGECGSCTVMIDGVPRYACLTLAVEAEGHEVTTVEGLMAGEQLGPVQQAFVEEDALQCGYCTSGQVVAAEGLLRKNANPDRAEIRVGMSGNLCRCGAYPHIFAAVERAAELRKNGGPR